MKIFVTKFRNLKYGTHGTHNDKDWWVLMMGIKVMLMLSPLPLGTYSPVHREARHSMNDTNISNRQTWDYTSSWKPQDHGEDRIIVMAPVITAPYRDTQTRKVSLRLRIK